MFEVGQLVQHFNNEKAIGVVVEVPDSCDAAGYRVYRIFWIKGRSSFSSPNTARCGWWYQEYIARLTR